MIIIADIQDKIGKNQKMAYRRKKVVYEAELDNSFFQRKHKAKMVLPQIIQYLQKFMLG